MIVNCDRCGKPVLADHYYVVMDNVTEHVDCGNPQSSRRVTGQKFVSPEGIEFRQEREMKSKKAV